MIISAALSAKPYKSLTVKIGLGRAMYKLVI